MSSIGLIPPGFTSFVVVIAVGLALLIGLGVQWWRERSLRGPLVALAATLIAVALLMLADAYRFTWWALGDALAWLDGWAWVWAPVAVLLWWGAERMRSGTH